MQTSKQNTNTWQCKIQGSIKKQQERSGGGIIIIVGSKHDKKHKLFFYRFGTVGFEGREKLSFCSQRE